MSEDPAGILAAIADPVDLGSLKPDDVCCLRSRLGPGARLRSTHIAIDRLLTADPAHSGWGDPRGSDQRLYPRYFDR